jgi:von Willebrand factor type A domain
VFPKSNGALLGPVLFAALAGIGCGSSGTLRVTKVAVSKQQPGNLALYLDVRDNGRPVPGLQEKDFRVYEDGKLISPKKGKRALLDADVVSANFAIVQVDLSGPVADSEYLPELAQTVAHFAQDLNDRQEVAVNAFDGNDEVAPFLAFGAGKEQFRKLADGLGKFRPRNRNSNLFGAVYQGISALEEKLAATAVAEKQATLIVFTDRADLSHTVGIEQMKEKLKSTPVQVYIIGVGEQINRQELTMLARAGTYLSNDPRAFKKGFEEINQKLVSLADGRYVLSYCSTKRKGSHKLEIEVETPNGEAKISHKFSAVGFKNGCTPTTKPVFEEIEALKADAVAKQKELDAKEKDKEEAEAAAAVAAIKAPEKEGGKAGSKDNAKAGAKEAAKSGSASAGGGPKAAANQTSKPAPPAAAKPAPKEAAAQVDLPPAEPEQPKASASPAKQAVDKE